MIYINRNRDIPLEEWDNIVNTLGLRQKLADAQSVVIKPNLAAGTYVDPKTHVISDLALLKSIIEYVCSVNKIADIYIAESDSTGYGFAFLKFEHLGLPHCLNLTPSILKRVKLLDMSRDRLERVESKNFLLYKTIDRQLWLSSTLLKADFIVSLSNLKTHAVTGYTGSCKNLFGCLPDFDKSVNHPRIHKVVHDLTLAINPDLSVVDAFYGMERNGPVQGIDVDTGYRVFSNDCFEADCYAAATIGYPVKKVGYLKKLAKTKGVKISEDKSVIVKYKKAGLFLRAMNTIGITIQGVGQGLASFGHRIHSCPSFGILLITIFRPILLRLFNYEKLKSWKKKITKK